MESAQLENGQSTLEDEIRPVEVTKQTVGTARLFHGKEVILVPTPTDDPAGK